MISEAMEDYLKALYTLGHEGPAGPVNTGALAATLGVAAPSVSGMLKRLATAGLVEHHPRRGARLTPAGEQAALRVVRHHRLLECYLSAALGYSWDAVHEEADRLEHHLSDKLVARMDATLGYPTVDPHGAPIPSREGTMAIPAGRALATVPVAAGGVVARVGVADAAKLRYLATLGLFPGVPVTVLETLPFNGPVRVRVGGAEEGREALLSRELAAEIFVRDER